MNQIEGAPPIKMTNIRDIKKIEEAAQVSFPLIKPQALNKAYKRRVLEEFDLPRKKKMIKYPPKRGRDNSFLRQRTRKIPKSMQVNQKKAFDNI